MGNFIRTNSKNTDFIELVGCLDAALKIVDGEDHDFYNQFNSIDMLHHSVVFYDAGKAVGCGALKAFETTTMEVKRMYVLPAYRGKGFATRILSELESWALELGQLRCILETGKKQPEAIALYTKSGYKQTENYGPYVGVDNSHCFEKLL